MAAVIGLLDLLISDDCLTNEQLETVSQIRKCSTALLRLLNSILDLSKVSSCWENNLRSGMLINTQVEILVKVSFIPDVTYGNETLVD